MSFPSLSREVDPWQQITQKIEGLGHARTTTELLNRCEEVYRNVGRLVDDIEKKGGDFGYRWSHVRTALPLQIRLIAEQIFYEKGGKYRQFVTGFKPMEGLGAASVGSRVSSTTDTRSSAVPAQEVSRRRK